MNKYLINMIAFVMFVIGTILGSFYLVVGTRLPKKENIVVARSKCDNCNHPLAWNDLIPILSFIFLKGKCRYCGKKISVETILVELITGSLFAFSYLYYGLTLHYYMFLVAVSVAIIIFISDFKYMVILDSPLIIGSIILIILRFLEIKNGVLYSILYGVLLFIVMYLIKLLGDKMFKRESLGGGDIKLCFFMGILLGYPGVGLRLGLIALIFSAFLALPYAVAGLYLNKKNELPYGPFLISASIIVFFFFEKFSNLLIFFAL